MQGSPHTEWASEKKQTLKRGGKVVGVQDTTLGWRLELSSWVLQGCCSRPEERPVCMAREQDSAVTE